MKCFYDTAQDAVGTCKSCGKGLSPDYAVDLGKGLACKGHCEDDVRGLIALIDNSLAMRGTTERIMRGSGRAGITTSIMFLLMGCTFLFTGLFRRDEPEPFIIVIGALFLIWSFFSFRRSLAIQRTMPNDKIRNA